jgi:hypothetical protein
MRNRRTTDSDESEVDRAMFISRPTRVWIDFRHAGPTYWLKGLPRMRGDRPSKSQ